MTKSKNTPKLRFPEFSKEWEEKKLGDILEVRYGKDYKHLGSGKYPVLGTGGIMTYVDTYLYSKESVLIGRKGSINNPLYINEPFWTVDTLFYTDIHDSFPKFVFYLVSTINWFKYNEASGVPSLSASSIKNVKIKISSFAEERYFHAVFEYSKVLEKYIQQKSKSQLFGTNLMNKELSINGSLKINSQQTQTEKDEQLGVMDLYRGLMMSIRNFTAHESALEKPIPKEDALDILSLISYLYRKIDSVTYFKKE